jgi:hypothetical protein
VVVVIAEEVIVIKQFVIRKRLPSAVAVFLSPMHFFIIKFIMKT